MQVFTLKLIEYIFCLKFLFNDNKNFDLVKILLFDTSRILSESCFSRLKED